MVRRLKFIILPVLLGAAAILFAADAGKYPAPRFPSYLKPPKSIEDVMPFARAAVRQTGGRTPLGLVEKGTATLIVARRAIAEPSKNARRRGCPPPRATVM